MPFRVLALAMILAAAMATSGCLWCRPWGCHHHHCCYAAPAASSEAVRVR